VSPTLHLVLFAVMCVLFQQALGAARRYGVVPAPILPGAGNQLREELAKLNPAEEVLQYAVAPKVAVASDVAQTGAEMDFAASAAYCALQEALAGSFARADQVDFSAPTPAAKILTAQQRMLTGDPENHHAIRPAISSRALDQSLDINAPMLSEPKLSPREASPGTTAQLRFQHTNPGSFIIFWLLCSRGFRQVCRDPSLMFLQLFVTILVAVATGLFFWHLGTDLTGIHNRTGLLFFVVVYFSLISMSSIGAIIADKQIFLRERAAALYSTEPYFASKIICDLLPLRLLPPVIFGLIVYPMCSLHRYAHCTAL
jgi:hypothetical protein